MMRGISFKPRHPSIGNSGGLSSRHHPARYKFRRVGSWRRCDRFVLGESGCHGLKRGACCRLSPERNGKIKWVLHVVRQVCHCFWLWSLQRLTNCPVRRLAALLHCFKHSFYVVCYTARQGCWRRKPGLLRDETNDTFGKPVWGLLYSHERLLANLQFSWLRKSGCHAAKCGSGTSRPGFGTMPRVVD